MRVGDREDSLPPEYRFNKEELEKLPAPKPEVRPGQVLRSLNHTLRYEALIITDGSFTVSPPAAHHGHRGRSGHFVWRLHDVFSSSLSPGSCPPILGSFCTGTLWICCQDNLFRIVYFIFVPSVLKLKTFISFLQTKVEDFSALDVLAGDFVAPAKASGVKAAGPPPFKRAPEVKLSHWMYVCEFPYLGSTLPSYTEMGKNTPNVFWYKIPLK